MSTYADPSKAMLWLDGDAFRAPAMTEMPEDIFADELAGWDAFGGIKAGFEVERTRETENLPVWNNRSGAPYRQRKDPPTSTIRMRPVDYSVATVLTLLQGGQISPLEGGTGWEMEAEEGEHFALILRVYDGTRKKAYYIAKAELGNEPTENLDGQDIEGWDLEITPLAPDGGGRAVRRVLSWNPLAGATPPPPEPETLSVVPNNVELETA